MTKSFIGRCAKVIREKGIVGFIKKINARHFDPLKVVFYPYINLRISSVIKQKFTAEKAVNFVFHRFGAFLKPYQFKSEILALAKTVEALRPKIVLEVGTSTGGTFFIWSRLSTPDAHLVSVDLPGGENDWAFPRWKEPFYKKFALPPQKINLLRGDSQTQEMLEKVKNILVGEKVDLLFIDADHSYEGVKKDYELYSPLMRSGGVIAFHDIVKFPDYTQVKVKDFWDEVKAGKKFEEYIEDPDQKWGGIGVIFVGE